MIGGSLAMKAHNSFEVDCKYDGEVDVLFIHVKKDFSYATSGIRLECNS